MGRCPHSATFPKNGAGDGGAITSHRISVTRLRYRLEMRRGLWRGYVASVQSTGVTALTFSASRFDLDQCAVLPETELLPTGEVAKLND